jgi:Flp pilus assembly protein TadG
MVLARLTVRLPGMVIPGQRERGAAIAEFAMIAALLVFLLFAVLQVAVFFYVRNIVAASASDGARYAANADVDYGVGGARASALVGQALTATVAQDVPCAGSAGVDAATGLPLAIVHCAGKVRSVFLPIGSLVSIDVASRAIKEGTP